MVWAAFRYSTNPQAVPTEGGLRPGAGRQGGAAVAARRSPQLAAKFKAQDEAHAKALAEKDELAAAKDAEIAELREQIKAAQAANQQTDDHDYYEAETRDLFIDVLLARGRLAADRRRGTASSRSPACPTPTGKGFVDYVLWGADGLPLAVVEAKRTTEEPADRASSRPSCTPTAWRQMTGRRPVIFYTNGYEHWIWDDAAGYPPREVQGFYTRDELELLIQRRSTRLPLADARDRHGDRRAALPGPRDPRDRRGLRPPSSARRCW